MPKGEDGEFGDNLDEGDQAMATYPALGQINASIPDQYKKPTKAMGNVPNAELTLKWAHGFRSFDTRGNLKYIQNDEVAFTTAGVGVVYSVRDGEKYQRFFDLHGEDIVSMAVHPNGKIIATGQMAGKELVGPKTNARNMQGAKGRKELPDGKLVAIYVWNADDMTPIRKIEGFHRRAVRHLKFSQSGRYLLSIGEDDFNSAAVYEWASGVKVADSKVAPRGTMKEVNSKLDSTVVFDCNWKNDASFAVCGPDFVKEFTLNGSNCNSTSGQFSATGFVP